MGGLSAGGGHVPVAVTTRSGVDESVHHGTVVITGPDGEVTYSAGNPDLPVYARSALKPLQAAAMLELGLDVSDEQLALVCASHDGTERHCEIVRSILAGAGLDETALANTAALPLDPHAARALVRRGAAASPLYMNCSGKHAGMVATCVSNGWTTGDYLEAEHPLQRHITATVDWLTGGVAHLGVDGCGAPTHVVTLAGLARSFARVAAERPRVQTAMTTYPDLVGGVRRDVSRLMRAVPGVMAKDGAEGVYAAALPGGGAVALKIADGASRARPAVMAAALGLAGLDVSAVPDDLAPPILGHGKRVGEVRAVLTP